MYSTHKHVVNMRSEKLRMRMTINKVKERQANTIGHIYIYWKWKARKKAKFHRAFELKTDDFEQQQLHTHLRAGGSQIR